MGQNWSSRPDMLSMGLSFRRKRSPFACVITSLLFSFSFLFLFGWSQNTTHPLRGLQVVPGRCLLWLLWGNS